MKKQTKNSKKHLHLSTSQIIILGFFLGVMIGCLLLMLPISTRDGQGASFGDALFTATSALCVTGLAVQDTATYWSSFGQAVLLTLIQIGGMGVITLAVAVTAISGKKISIMQRNTMQEAISAPNMSGIVRLTTFILKITACTELICAAIMYPVFWKEFGPGKGLWYSIFHSISAFCNAGFDLMGVKEQFSSLTYFHAQPLINIIIMFLIIFGGIGFLTWEDVKTHKFRFSKYRMQTKVILCMTILLITLPALWLFFYEYGPTDLPTEQKILASLFQSVTLRTAGFNTMDLNAISEPGQALMIFLMLIGGAPGSTAGGMKVTTIAVLFACSAAVFRHYEDAHFFQRRVDSEVIRYAATIFIMYMTLFFFSGIAISAIDGLPLKTCFFETASAVGTVGLTLGITPSLSTISRLILIVLMFSGRVGGLTVVFAALSGQKRKYSKYPKEKITVG